MSSDKDNKKLNFKAIVSGWTNFVFKSETVKELATERAKICSECPHINPNHKFKKWIPEDNSIKEISGAACGKCGCPLSAKVRQVLESCPDKRWD